ncbi:hypothetical protein PGTUg99_026787 [Puccinia graminis f. sp. tritici]|uniref:Uncharacterized protein n=1 Tax=Puccinia graminis f. sp. tritici TaxID=56615 RepID=A0A5B0N455_PUCGR|nr:hypothetical protein PGTUg99_026787 [Puccinia graminis f. sp. tritici]
MSDFAENVSGYPNPNGYPDAPGPALLQILAPLYTLLDSTRLSTSTSGSPIKTRKIQDDPTSLKFQSSSIFLNKFSSGCSSLSIAFSTCFVLL